MSDEKKELCEEQADCLKGIDIRKWPNRCYDCGHASAQAQAKEIETTKSRAPSGQAEFALLDAARALTEKMNLIHNDPSYQGVWHMAAVHGANYRGPDYKEELETLEAVLASI